MSVLAIRPVNWSSSELPIDKTAFPGQPMYYAAEYH